MLKRLITILLLFAFGALPLAACVCDIALLASQNEEDCCASGSECKMAMTENSDEPSQDESPCFCGDVSEKNQTGIIASISLMIPVIEAQKNFSQVFAASTISLTDFSYEVSPHHKSNQTYLKNSCLRI